MKNAKPSREIGTLFPTKPLVPRVAKVNLAIGYAYETFGSALTAGLEFPESETLSNIDLLESELIESFKSAFSQFSLPKTRALIQPSATYSIQIAAKVLREHGVKTVHVLTPTFGKISPILQNEQLITLPVAESEVEKLCQGEPSCLSNCEALFLVLPNIPTGFELDSERFSSLCSFAHKTGAIICLDHTYSFYTNFSPRETNYYSILESTNVSYMCIEDTGKVIACSSLKVGLIISSENLHHSTCRQVYLYGRSIPSFILQAIVHALRSQNLPKYFERLKFAIHENRRHAHSRLQKHGIEVCGADGMPSIMLYGEKIGAATPDHLYKSGVLTIGSQFFFWNQASHRSFIRITLHHDPVQFIQFLDSLIRAI